MIGYVLLLRQDIIIGGLPTKMVGPFKTTEALDVWVRKHLRGDAEAKLTTIYTPAENG